MNIDQVYDELYGVIDKNKAADAATQGKVVALEGTVTTQGETIAALQTAIPEVPGRQLKLVDLGTEYTQELKEDIYSGTFEKAIVGGYLTINEHVYIFAHPDYWLGTGDTSQTETTEHHMLVIPAKTLGTGVMNLTDTTAGGYYNSDMRVGHEDTTDPENPVHVDGALKAVQDIIIADFGATNILSHRESLTSAVTDGIASANQWVDSTIDLPNEFMLFGCPINGSNPYREARESKTQLKLFAERPDLLTYRTTDYWLRDVNSDIRFCGMSRYSYPANYEASDSRGIRPVFAIKGAPPETSTRKRSTKKAG